MLTNVDHGSSVIVYRSEGEALINQWLYNDGGIVYIFGIVLVTALIGIGWSKYEAWRGERALRAWNRRGSEWR